MVVALLCFKSDIDVCMRNNIHNFIVASLNTPIFLEFLGPLYH
jgi:hypothetical protein